MRKNTSFMSFEMLDDSNFKQAPMTTRNADSVPPELKAASHHSSGVSESGRSEASSNNRYLTLDTTYILEQAFQRISNPGSATAVIGVLNPRNNLQVSNLGDSGFLHYRQRTCSTIPKAGSSIEMVIGNTSLISRSKCQTHSFNIPY